MKTWACCSVGRTPSERTQKRPKYLVLLVSGFSLVRLVLSTPNSSSLLAMSKSEAVTKGEEDTVRDCLRHWGHTQVLETRWDAITGATGAGQYHCMALLNHFWKVMVARGSSLSLEKRKDYTCPQQGKEEKSRRLHAAQSHLNSWKSYGANPPLSHFWAHKGWQSVASNQQQSTTGKWQLTSLAAFHNAMPCSMDKRGANNVYFDFCKVFDLTSWNILIPKLVMHGLYKWVLMWVKFTRFFV